MITWIIMIALIMWLIRKRVIEVKKVKDAPLGLPVGTIRSLIAIMIVSFPFNYLLNSDAIPSFITSTIFVVVAFYFEKRVGEKNFANLVKEVKEPGDILLKKEYMPMYFPKYTVRGILVSMLVAVLVINHYGPDVPFETRNTFVDLLIMIVLFVIGMYFRSIRQKRLKKRIRKYSLSNPDATTASIIKHFEEKEKIHEKRQGSFLAILMLLSVTGSLLMYNLSYDLTYALPLGIVLSLREIMLLLINVYFGYRQ